MQLSEHFQIDEFITSQTAARKGIDNTPSATVIHNLTFVAAGLEKVRSLLGHPISISSGYRSLDLNRAVGGASTSAHVTGYAADFICPAYGSPKQIAMVIAASGIKFDQIIMEGTWVHISFAPAMRQDILSATFVNGKATYQKGIH